jgi:hypothetical protein
VIVAIRQQSRRSYGERRVRAELADSGDVAAGDG